MRLFHALRASLSIPSGRGGLLLLALLAVTFAAGCSSGGTTNPDGSFTLALSSGVLTITQGSNGAVTVTIERSGDFAGAVTITVTGLPTGVTAGALTIGAGSTSGQLTLTATGAATVGNASLTVRGAGSGVGDDTAPLALTVNSATAPGFTLSLNPNAGSVQAGSSLQTTVTINRTGGFAGAVTLSATGLPAGVTPSFNPAATTGASSILTLTAAGGATASGPTQVTVQGAATGIPNQTAQIALTVTVPGGGGGGNVTMEFCGAVGGGLPLWVAFQDGTGAWTRADGAGPTYSTQINANTGAVAWVTTDVAGGFTLNVMYATRAELNQTGGDRCLDPGAGKTVTGTVAGLVSQFQFPSFALGGAPISGAAPNFLAPGVTFSGVPNGSVALIGSIANFDPGTQSLTPSRVYIQRNLTPAPASSVGTIDLFGANSFAPEQRNLTINGVGGGETVVQTNLLYTTQGFGQVSNATGQNSWYAVPGAQLAGSDIQLLTVLATNLAGGGLAPQRSVQRALAAPTDLTVTLGPDLSVPTVTSVAETGYIRGRITYPIQTQYQRYWVANFAQGPQPGHTSRSTQIQMTSGYRASTTGEVVLDTPNFTGVTGWTALWGLRSGTPVTWTMNATGWTTPGGINQPILTAGETFFSALRFGQFTP